MALGRHLVAQHIGSPRWAVAFFVLLLFSSPTSADALTSQRFTGAVKARNVVLITYRDVITKHGLKAMRRPAG